MKMNQSTENDLSMIDCGIKSLKEVPLKLSLRSLNLHSNKLIKIENLTYLQNLNHLDLSSNQIKQINGLNGLGSLTSLNLSCNFITSIENLTSLKHLKWLNVSYNKIQFINGLSDLWGADYSIETILLNGNFITSLEETTYYLSGLKHLKYLTLSDNKLKNDYRPIVFSTVKSLSSLDGKDKLNKPMKPIVPIVTNEFNEWNTTPINKSFNDLFKKSETYKQNLQVKKPMLQIESMECPKLDVIESKIHQLLSIRDKIKTQTNDQDDEIDLSVSVSNIFPKKHSPKPVSILKPAIVNLNSELSKSDSKLDAKESTTEINSNQYSVKHANELIGLMKTQLESYKQSQDLNLKLIAELRLSLDNLTIEKQKIINEKKDSIRSLNEKNNLLSLELDNLKKTIEITTVQAETQSTKCIQIEKEKLKENLETVKKQMKKYYQNEMEKQTQQNEIATKQNLSKIESLEKSLRSLEDEFRAALIIESNRYNELFLKYEQSNKESNDSKSSFKILEISDERNKSLIKELNELIKEQKYRLQQLAKIRKETSGDIQKRDEKLTEAVTDCTKLKNQIEQLKKDKKNLEIKLKSIAIEYNQIRTDKETWNKKLNDQKTFLMQDNNRLTIDNQNLLTELDLLKKNLDRENDSCKIKTKIIEDQTETIKKLKNAMIERDDLVKQNRDDSLSAQKSLEKQLNEEMNLSNELQLKLDKSNQRKEELKLQVHQLEQNLEETKYNYEELTEKWKQKTQLISDLDIKVRKMKENYEQKEKSLINEKETLLQENQQLTERLHKIDDEFRHQYDVEKREHYKSIEKLKRDYEIKLKQSDERVKEIEEEMRLILIESSSKKKFYEDKIKSFSQMFSQIQNDFEVK